MRQVKTAHDPAPSRLNYRLQRWMLTPAIRTGLRVGLPLALIAGTVAGYLMDEARRTALVAYWTDTRESLEERPEFMVGQLTVEGAGTGLTQDIHTLLGIDFPISSFDLDLEAVRAKVMTLDPVKEASLRIRPGGVLEVEVTERTPVVIWRNHHGLFLLDETGAIVDMPKSRTDHPDLPLIAGAGANAHTAEALALLAAAAPLRDRLRGLVRMGERRWDVVLDRDQRILLPVDRPVPALERVIALNEAQEILERDVVAVDLRLAERPTLRMSNEAVQDWWRLRQINEDRQGE